MTNLMFLSRLFKHDTNIMIVSNNVESKAHFNTIHTLARVYKAAVNENRERSLSAQQFKVSQLFTSKQGSTQVYKVKTAYFMHRKCAAYQQAREEIPAVNLFMVILIIRRRVSVNQQKPSCSPIVVHWSKVSFPIFWPLYLFCLCKDNINVNHFGALRPQFN